MRALATDEACAAAAASAWLSALLRVKQQRSVGRAAAQLPQHEDVAVAISRACCASGTQAQAKRGVFRVSCTERARSTPPDEPCVGTAPPETMDQRRRRRSERTSRARERAAKVCGRGSRPEWWIAGLPGSVSVKTLSGCDVAGGRRPKHVCTTVTVFTPRRYRFHTSNGYYE